jgi:hypothetical protein
MKPQILKNPPLVWGISIGVLVSIVCWVVYFVVLHEPGSAFYPFAALAFLGAPLIGGAATVFRAQDKRLKAFFTSSAVVFGIVWMFFIFTYVVLPQFDRRNVQLPAFCDGWEGRFNPPVQLAYTLPGVGTGVLLTSDAQSAVMVMIDASQPPFPSSVYLINRSDNKMIRGMGFNNDVVSGTIQDGTLYLYNDKLGYLMDARTGEFEEDFLLIDNYGGLTETDRPFISRASDGHWYMETTAVISSWNINGTVKSRPDLTLNGIARGCFIAGDTQVVMPLR